MPRRSEPIEAFTFDKETNVYSLTIMPDRFAYYFDSLSDLDDSYKVEDVIKAEIKLSNSKSIQSNSFMKMEDMSNIRSILTLLNFHLI